MEEIKTRRALNGDYCIHLDFGGAGLFKIQIFSSQLPAFRCGIIVVFYSSSSTWSYDVVPKN